MVWAKQVFATELRKIIAYRVDFWLQYILSIFAHIGVAYFLWKAIFDYRSVTSMRGYTFAGLMLYYMSVPLISRMVNGPGMGMVAREIYDGSLTRYLIYPISFFNFKYIQYLANTVVYFMQFIVALALFTFLFGKPDDVQITSLSLIMGIGAILSAGFMAFTLSTLIEMTAFWADNVWSLLVMIRFAVGLLGGAMIPLSFFPAHFERILHFMPFAFLASFPINTFIGKVTYSDWLLGLSVIIFWSCVFYFLARLVWSHGRYKYTGVGI